MMLKFSIITINLNNDNGLKQTIASVITQSYPEIEYIVIDGGSNDESLNIITQNKNRIAFYISEQDNGIYHAMNKGIAVATGDYCLFLNSGDILISENIIEKVAKIIIEHNGLEDIIYGDIVLDNGDYLIPHEVSLTYLYTHSLPHQSSFIKRELFSPNHIGTYIESFKIISDWIFTLKAYSHQAKFLHIPLAITLFATDGISSKETCLLISEKSEAIDRYFNNFKCDFDTLNNYQQIQNSKTHKLLDRLLFFYRKILR